jgi:hypothetical protein
MARSPHDDRSFGAAAYSSAIGAVVFALFVAAGAAYIIGAKLVGTSQIYVTFVPVATMVAYALLMWLARNLRLRDDQAGDNLYYMGFLFTLTSLGVSLYQFNASGAAEEIVQNFGIAIGTTITGIALRVIFNQMRHDPVEIERTMRLELAEAARRVRRELDSTVVEFGYVRRTAHQAAADSFNLIVQRFDDIAVKLLGRAADVAAKSAAPLEAASRRSTELIDELTNKTVGAIAASAQQLAAETARLSTSTGEIVAALDVVTSKLGTMRTPDGVVEVRLQPVVQALSETMTQAIDRFALLSQGQAAAIQDVIGATKIAAESSSASIVAMRQEIAANSAANGATLERATAIITAMAQILEEFEADARTQVEMVRHLMENSDEAVRSLTAALVNSGADLARHSGGLPDMLASVEANARTLATATERIAGIADELDAERMDMRRAAPKWETIK